MKKLKNTIKDILNSSTLSRWLIPPADGWHRKSKNAFVSSNIYWPIIFLASCLATSVLMISLDWLFPKWHQLFYTILFLISLSAILFLIILVAKIEKNLLVPLTHIRHWAGRMRGGNLVAHIPLPKEKNEFYELAFDINNLGASLKNLTHDMRQQVKEQTDRVAQQSNSLAILYEIATSINQSKDLNDLLSQFLNTLKKTTNAEAASIRIATVDDQLSLISHTGLLNPVLQKEKNIPIDLCHCGKTFREKIISTQDISVCGKIMGTNLCHNAELKMIAVPVMYRGKCIGVYNLFVKDSELIDREEFTSLLTSIGQHLGVAIAKNQLENQTNRNALMEERLFLSHELHDSLAQTLVSLKYQLNLLTDSIQHRDITSIEKELNNMGESLDKANSDLRDLLDHFRTQMDDRGLIPAIRELVHNFQTDTGMSCYFQDETKGHKLLPNYEIQVLHIVQEALSNIRKHSKAQNARVIIRTDDENWNVIIEDDGLGINTENKKSKPGENVGLNIMQERAAHIEGTLQIESEIDEGTRIELNFVVKNTPELLVNSLR